MRKINSWATFVLVIMLAALCAGALASCDSGPAHCAGANDAMTCVTAKLPAPKDATVGVSSSTVSGIDFAWSCPSPADHNFGVSYLSDSSKDWTPACLSEWHAAGDTTVAVGETAGTRALDGCAAGTYDAEADAAELTRLGAPAGQPFTLAIDFDAVGAQLPQIAVYFHCALAAEPGRVNAYGGYYQILYLSQHGDVGHLNYQAYAWSDGLWLPASIAPLEQYLNGSAVDYDRALLPYYGQWPYKAAPARPPGPTPKQISGDDKARDASLKVYHHLGCTMPVLGPKNCATFATRVVYFQQKSGVHVACFGHHADTSAPVCQIVRPRVSIRSRARNATSTAYMAHNCQGIATFGEPVHSKLCDALNSRDLHFARLVTADLKLWS